MGVQYSTNFYPKVLKNVTKLVFLVREETRWKPWAVVARMAQFETLKRTFFDGTLF
jgi:hypothetical protein